MKLLLLFIALLILLLKQVESAVLGIDFGSEFFKVCLISPGKSFVIVENIQSKRKTHTALSFQDGERLYGQDAYNRRSRNPVNTFMFLKKFIKPKTQLEGVYEESKKNGENYLFASNSTRDTISFELKNFAFADNQNDEKIYLNIEEVLGMIFRQIKVLSEKMAKVGDIKDCIITVPADWNLNQRKLLDEAAQLGGLKPLGVMNENGAAALYYSIDRQDVNETHTVIFLNIGSTALKVSVVDFFAQNTTTHSNTRDNNTNVQRPIEIINVLADVVDQSVSGLKFDQVLAEYFAEEFDNLPSRKGQPSIKTSFQARVRLLQTCQKTKEVLSANKEAPVYIESLFEGEDFKSHITRQKFEELSQPIFDNIIPSIELALKKANRTLKDVHRLEIIGGAVRVPKIQQILNEFLNGVELGAHLNGDEAMALGAVFHAANLSHSFKVRQIWLNDGFSFAIKLVIKSLNETLEPDQQYFKELILFPEKARYNSRKMVQFSYDENLQFQFFQVNTDTQEEELIKTYNFTNITNIYQNEKFSKLGIPKLQFQFFLNSITAVELDFAEAVLQELKINEYEVEVKIDENGEEILNTSSVLNATDNSNNSSSKNYTTKKVTKQNATIIKHYLQLKYYEELTGLTSLNKTEFKNSQQKLKHFDKHEDMLHKRAEAKNKLEAYIYEINEYKLNENYINHGNQTEHEEINKLLEENDQWIYSDEASTSNYTIFTERYEQIYNLTTKILYRMEQTQKRPLAIEQFYSKIENLTQKVSVLNKTMSWVSDQQKEPINREINIAVEWLKNISEFQAKMPLDEDPLFNVNEIDDKLKKINDEYDKVKKIKKPEPEKNETSTTTKNQQNQTKSEQQSNSNEKSEEKNKEESKKKNEKQNTEETQSQQQQDDSKKSDL